MSQIYFTSDLHFCHDREFLYRPRGFESISDMNKSIVRNWNEIVSSDAQAYILGDVMLCNNEEGIRLLKQLNGKIHIICGNHCTDARRALYENCDNVVEVVDAKRLKYDGYHFFLSHYPCLCANYDDGRSLKKQCISLCGHTHTKDRFADWDKGRIYHVEADAHNCYPVSIEEIIMDCEGKYNAKTS